MFAIFERAYNAAGKLSGAMWETCKSTVETCKEAAYAVGSTVKLGLDGLETVVDAGKSIFYASKTVVYNIPVHLSNKFGSHKSEEAKAKALADSWRVLTDDCTCVKTSIIDAFSKGGETIKDGVNIFIHVAYCAKAGVTTLYNVGETLYRTGETTYEAGVVAEQSVEYAITNGVIPAAKYASGVISPAVQYVGTKSATQLTWLSDKMRITGGTLATSVKEDIEMTEFARALPVLAASAA